jgi:glutamate formiminotransferase
MFILICVYFKAKAKQKSMKKKLEEIEKKKKEDFNQLIKDKKEKRKKDAKRLKKILKPRICSAKQRVENL